MKTRHTYKVRIRTVEIPSSLWKKEKVASENQYLKPALLMPQAMQARAVAFGKAVALRCCFSLQRLQGWKYPSGGRLQGK